jgi:hypothetical protein
VFGLIYCWCFSYGVVNAAFLVDSNRRHQKRAITSWEDYSGSASQKRSPLLEEFDGPSQCSKEPTVDHLLSHKNAVTILKSYLLKIHFGSISSKPRLPNSRSQIRIANNNFDVPFIFALRTTCSYSFFVIWWRRVQIVKLLIP